MKLRRALSVTAVTAALLPAAVAAAPATQAAPAADLPSCSDVSNGNYQNNALVGRSFGIPQSITLGNHWNTYTATLTNVSAKELTSFGLSARLDSYIYNEGEHDLRPYGDLQYWDAAQKAWKTLRQADGETSGPVPGPRTLKPRESVNVQLRFRVREGLPDTQNYDAYTHLVGTFADSYNGTACAAGGEAGSAFGIPMPAKK